LRVFFTELKRAALSPGFLAAAAGTAAAGLIGGRDTAVMLARGGAWESMGEMWEQLMFAAMYSNIFLLVLPILSTLPYTGAFADDLNSQFIRTYLPRAGRRRYLISRTAATALSGGMAVTLGVLMLMLAYIVAFPPLGLSEAGIEMMPTLFSLFQAIVLVFLNAGLWALIGGVAAAIMRNKYIAYACPFILYYVATSFQQRYSKTAHFLSPREWIMPGHTDWYVIFGMVVGLCAVVGVALALLMKWRLKNA
jgi:hypothetical protein